MSRKRQLEEIDHIAELQEPVTSASFHAAVLSISPVKKGKNTMFFDGRLTDGIGEVRMVGFNAQQQKQLSILKETRQSIKLDNCEIKQSRQGHKMEVILKNTTKISESPKKIQLPDDSDELPIITDLVQLPLLSNFTKVSVDVKVLNITEPMTMTGGKQKQEVTIGDQTATARVTLWEQHVGMLNVNLSYSLKNFIVREYAASKYLAMARDGSEIVQIDDIGDAVCTDSDAVKQMTDILDPVIIGVPYLDSYKACIRCKARVEPQTPPLGRCSRDDCSMMQRYDICKEQLSAKIMFMHGVDQYIDTFQAFGKMVSDLASNTAEGEDVTPQSLLRAPPLDKLTVNDKKVIIGLGKRH